MKTVLLIIVCCLLFICGKPPGPKLPDKYQPLYHVLTDWHKNNLCGRVKSITIIWHSLEKPDDSLPAHWDTSEPEIQQYNTDGFITYESRQFQGKTAESKSYTYDTNTHFLLKCKMFFTWGTVGYKSVEGVWNYTNTYISRISSNGVITHYEKSYDSTSDKIRPVSKFNPDGTIADVMVLLPHRDPVIDTIYERYNYDKNQRLIEFGEYGSNTAMWDKETYKYNSAGFISEMTRYESDESIEFIKHYYYDINNRLTCDSINFPLRDSIQEIRTAYQDYDSVGNWTKTLFYYGGSCNAILERKIDYYEGPPPPYRQTITEFMR